MPSCAGLKLPFCIESFYLLMDNVSSQLPTAEKKMNKSVHGGVIALAVAEKKKRKSNAAFYSLFLQALKLMITSINT